MYLSKTHYTSKIILEMPGIEPGASRMLSARSTTELHPLICRHNVVISQILFTVRPVPYNQQIWKDQNVVRMAERSKAPDLSSGTHMCAWVRTPLLTVHF